MSCHRSSGSLRNWNIDYAELWSYLVVWERWLRGENVPLLSSNRLHSLPASQPRLAWANFAAAAATPPTATARERSTGHTWHTVAMGMKYDICSAAMEDPGYIADGSTVALRLRDVAPAATAAPASAAGSRRNTHLLIAKDPAKSHFNVGLICCRRPL